MVRLYVAVHPPPDVLDILASFDCPPMPGVRWSSREQWIVKLRPLGHVAGNVVPALRDVLDAELDGAPAPRCILGPTIERLGGDWLAAPVAGLDDLAATVFAATGELVPVTHPQPFRADIVLARGRVPASLAGRAVSASWTAREVCLVADRSSPRHVRHEDVAIFRLGS